MEKEWGIRKEIRTQWEEKAKESGQQEQGKVPIAMGSRLPLAFIPKFPSNAAAPSVWSLITTADTA